MFNNNNVCINCGLVSNEPIFSNQTPYFFPKRKSGYKHYQILKHYSITTEKKKISQYIQNSNLLCLKDCLNKIREICDAFRLSEKVRDNIISSCIKISKKHYIQNDYTKSIMYKSRLLPKFIIFLSFKQNSYCFSQPKIYYFPNKKYKTVKHYNELSLTPKTLWGFLKIRSKTGTHKPLSRFVEFKRELGL